MLFPARIKICGEHWLLRYGSDKPFLHRNQGSQVVTASTGMGTGSPASPFSQHQGEELDYPIGTVKVQNKYNMDQAGV